MTSFPIIFVLAIAAIVVAFLAYVAIGIYRMITPTRGRKIDHAARPGSALVIIDMQDDFTNKRGKNGFGDAAVASAIDTVNRHIEMARSQNIPVAVIRQVQYEPIAILVTKLLAGSEGLAGSPGLGLDPRIDASAAPDFEKSRADAFSNKKFEAWLAENHIGQLKLVGLDGCYCVQATAHGALNRGYAVEILQDGVLTAFPARWQECKMQLQARGAAIAGET